MLDLFAIKGKTFTPWCVHPGEDIVIPLFEYGGSMSKVASSLDYVPTIKRFVNRAKPEDGWYTLLIHANGTDEVWGPNNKGDCFPEHWLAPPPKVVDYGYKTFETNARGYVHHRNSPEHWAGKVLLAEFNAPMGRVELIAKFSKRRLLEEGTPYFVEALEKGSLPAVSMGCFTAGNLVSMADGTRKPIEDIRVGDLVLTHRGRARKVSELHRRKYKGDIVSFSTASGLTTRCTKEHPFFSVRYTSDESSVGADPVWTHAGCLGDFLLIEPVLSETFTPEYVDRTFSRLFGYYVAAGKVLRDSDKNPIGIEFVFKKSDSVLQEIFDLCRMFGIDRESVFFRPCDLEELVSLSAFDGRLATLCHKNYLDSFGKKMLSDSVMRWGRDLQREFFGAFVNGSDAAVSDDDLTISLNSSDLTWQLASIMPRFGIIPSVSTINGSSFVVSVGGVFAKTLSDVCFKASGFSNYSGCGCSGGDKKLMHFGITREVEEFSAVYAEVDVYNFEVEEDQSYVVNGLAVHNCRVKYDICSVCGNKAPSPTLYCDHLKFSRLEVLPDGRRVRMYNPFPIFHDISLVSRPADPAARVLLKVAEDGNDKVSEMEKRVRAVPVGGLKRLNKKEFAATISTADDPDLTLQTLATIASLPKHAAYSALTGFGIILRPHEFAAIEYVRNGKFDKAAAVYGTRSQFPVYDYAGHDPYWYWVNPLPSMERFFSEFASSRSVYIPAFERRSAEKIASSPLPESTAMPVEDGVVASYGMYRKSAETYLLDDTAPNWAKSKLEILTAIYGRDIPLSIKFASLNDPKEVFSCLVRGAFLPTSNL